MLYFVELFIYLHTSILFIYLLYSSLYSHILESLNLDTCYVDDT